MVYKALGKIVYDSETKTIKALHVPIILDMVQDQVRNRWYSVTLVSFVVVSLAFWTLGPVFRDPGSYSGPLVPVAGIQLMVGSTIGSVAIGGQIMPFPVVRVVDATNGGLWGKIVRASISPHGQVDDPLSPYHATLAGELSATTNSQGIVIFLNLTVASGMQGILYDLIFSCDELIIISTFSLTSNIQSVNLHTSTPPPYQVVIGSPIPAFNVCVTNASGLSSSGKIVRAFVNQFPEPGSLSPRYGYLGGNMSITGANGCANFSSLTLLGASTNRLSLSFACEGVLLTKSFEELGILFTTNVGSVAGPSLNSGVDISEDPYPLYPNIYAQIQDSNGNPLSGKYVFAMLSGEGGYSNVQFSSIVSYHKTLAGYMAGPSDAYGMVTFANLVLMGAGMAGQYELTLFCDGVASQPTIFNVQSAVFMAECTGCGDINLAQKSYDDSWLLIKAINYTGGGVAGKPVNLVMTYPDSLVSIIVNVTNQDGYAMWNPYDTTSLSLSISAYFSVDGFNTSAFQITPSPSSSPGCAFIEVLTPPSGSYIIGQTGPQPRVRAIDSQGNGIPDVKIRATTSPSPGFYFYAQNFLMKEYLVEGEGTTDSNGYVQFNNFQVLSGYSGSSPVIFVSESEQCWSDYHVVSVANPISSVAFSTPQSATSLTIQPNSVVPFTVVLSVAFTGMPQHFATIYVVSSSSPSLLSQFFSGPGTSFVATTLPSNFLAYTSDVPCIEAACSFGNMTLLPLYGNYAIIAEVDGMLSLPIYITIPPPGGAQLSVPAVPSTVQVDLQEVFPIQPLVKVIDGNGHGLSGVYVVASSCNSNKANLVNFQNNSTLPISLLSDGAGNAAFEGLAIFSGGPGTHTICFSILGQHTKTQWPVTITLQTFSIQFDIGSYPSFVVPGQSWSITGSVTTVNTQANMFPIQLKVEDSPTSSYQLKASANWLASSNETFSFSPITLNGTAGNYEFTLETSGFKSSTISVTLLDAPSSINVGVKSVQAIVGQLVQVPVTVFAKSKLPLSNAYVTSSLVTHRGGVNTTNSTNAGVLYPPYTTSMTNENGTAVMQILFTAGVPGPYMISFACGLLTSNPIIVNLTNKVANVTLVSKIAGSVIYDETLFYPLYVRVIDSEGNPVPGKVVVPYLLGLQGSGLQQTISVTNSSGVAAFWYISVMAFIPGYYSLQFAVDGIVSHITNISLTNPAFPDFKNLDLETAQTFFFIICLITIPLFIGNSTRQPSWQLVVSIILGSILLCVMYAMMTRYVPTAIYSVMYALLTEFMGLTFFVTLFSCLAVGIYTVAGWCKKKNFNFYEVKNKSCTEYVRRMLFPSKRIQKVDTPKSLPRKIWNAFKQPFIDLKAQLAPSDAGNEEAFFYPQRLLIGMGVSVCCLFVAATGSVLVFSWPIYLLNSVHDNLYPYLLLSRQFSAYLDENAQAEGVSLADYINNMIDQFVSLQVSPFGVAFISQIVNDDIPRMMHYIEVLDHLVINIRDSLQRSYIIAILSMFAVVVTFKIFVFYKYKRRIKLLRQGKYKEIFFHPEAWSISPAANYIGLSAIHAAVGYFLLCFCTVIVACILQYKPLYSFIYSYFPVIATFLVGFPFISKMITKFIVAKYIVSHSSIKHFRLWAVFDFLWIFVNLLSVLALTTIRFTVSVIASFIIITRMDEPVLHSKYASYDYGFAAYAGTLLMDHYHNNPILLIFVEFFIQNMKTNRLKRKEAFLQKIEKENEERRQSEELQYLLPLSVNQEDSESVRVLMLENKERTRKSQVVGKWWLLYLLHKNPTLQEFRSRGRPEM